MDTLIRDIDALEKSTERMAGLEPPVGSWFGVLPEHWGRRRLKFLVRERKERGTSGGESVPYIGLENIESWTGRLKMAATPEEGEADGPESSTNDFRVGDVLFGKLRPYLAKVARPDFDGVCTTETLVLTSGPEIDGRYLQYALLSNGFIRLIDGMTYGTKMPRANAEQVLDTVFPVPPLNEQRRIADRLDTETARIDGLIGKKRYMISYLRERRSASIYNAVTKGLSTDEPMRYSGFEWIGAIPEHWQAKKTKFVARLRSGHTPDRKNETYWINCSIPWVSLADVWQIRDPKRMHIETTAEKISELGLANSSAVRLPSGTVIVSRTASVGFSGILSVEMATTQDFVNWTPGPEITSEYLLFVFRAMEREFSRMTIGSTHKTIYMPDVANFSAPLPPLREQKEIVEHLLRLTDRIDQIVGRIESSIALLIERKNALIMSAVTGRESH